MKLKIVCKIHKKEVRMMYMTLTATYMFPRNSDPHGQVNKSFGDIISSFTTQREAIGRENKGDITLTYSFLH